MFAREGGPGRVAPGWIAHERGEVADDQDDLVAEVLELTELPKRHRMAEVKVRRRRVHAELDDQGPSAAQFLEEGVGRHDASRAARDDVHLLLRLWHSLRCLSGPPPCAGSRGSFA